MPQDDLDALGSLPSAEIGRQGDDRGALRAGLGPGHPDVQPPLVVAALNAQKGGRTVREPRGQDAGRTEIHVRKVLLGRREDIPGGDALQRHCGAQLPLADDDASQQENPQPPPSPIRTNPGRGT